MLFVAVVFLELSNCVYFFVSFSFKSYVKLKLIHTNNSNKIFATLNNKSKLKIHYSFKKIYK